MNYVEPDPGAPAVNAQESADESQACAQIERDRQQQLQAAAFNAWVDSVQEHAPF